MIMTGGGLVVAALTSLLVPNSGVVGWNRAAIKNVSDVDPVWILCRQSSRRLPILGTFINNRLEE